MKKLMLLMLFVLSLFANSDLIEIKQNTKLILHKLNELDKKVEVNSIKIEMLQNRMNKRFEDIVNFLWMISIVFLVLAGVTYRLCNIK